MSESFSAYQAAQAYRGVSLTVSPLKAVVMLLDGAITLLKKSIEAGEAKRLEESHNHIVRTTAILRGLSQHLDVAKGGALAVGLSKTYNSLILACLRSFGQPDAATRYRRIISSLTELRDAWASVLSGHANRLSKP
jgi:flagellar secretion chaperone FliS